MKIIYIAGPFRAPTAWGIAENVRAAERRAFQCASLGAMPLVPHANTARFRGTLTDGFWLKGTMELMLRCDAVLLVPGWEGSSGTAAEIFEAKCRCIPVFHTLEELDGWLSEPVQDIHEDLL